MIIGSYKNLKKDGQTGGGGGSSTFVLTKEKIRNLVDTVYAEKSYEGRVQALETNMPSKISQLTNDSGFITIDDIKNTTTSVDNLLFTNGGEFGLGNDSIETGEPVIVVFPSNYFTEYYNEYINENPDFTTKVTYDNTNKRYKMNLNDADIISFLTNKALLFIYTGISENCLDEINDVQPIPILGKVYNQNDAIWFTRRVKTGNFNENTVMKVNWSNTSSGDGSGGDVKGTLVIPDMDTLHNASPQIFQLYDGYSFLILCDEMHNNIMSLYSCSNGGMTYQTSVDVCGNALSEYYNRDETDSKIAEQIQTIPTFDASHYYDKTETDSVIQQKIDAIPQSGSTVTKESNTPNGSILVNGTLMSVYDDTDIKKSVADGKSLVATAISAKGIDTATNATFSEMAQNIAKLANDANLLPENIKKNISILGVTGTYDGDSINGVTESEDKLDIDINGIAKSKVFVYGRNYTTDSDNLIYISKNTDDSLNINASSDKGGLIIDLTSQQSSIKNKNVVKLSNATQSEFYVTDEQYVLKRPNSIDDEEITNILKEVY